MLEISNAARHSKIAKYEGLLFPEKSFEFQGCKRSRAKAEGDLMVSSKAKTVDQYLKELPEDRRTEISAVRDVILANLPKGFVEGMSHGMIAYYIPLEDYSDTYNGEPLGLAGIAAQKNSNSLYLMNVYADRKLGKWFKDQYKKSGKKLDMGKSCVHYKRAEDLPLDLIGETIARESKDAYIKSYQDVRGSARLKRG